MIEQTLIDVADLFNVQCPERQAAGFSGTTTGQFHLQQLQSVEQVQDGRLFTGSGSAGQVFHVVPCLRPSRNGNRSGSKSLPP